MSKISSINNIVQSEELTPFVKWVGGKRKLISQIVKLFPSSFGTSINKYAEPFVGGGALLFYILSRYKLKSVYISDINLPLINCYKIIRDECEDLIYQLLELQKSYLDKTPVERQLFYYSKRSRFNELIANSKVNIELALLFIFLNKTCFNGLYRVNSKEEFNVPFGKYKSLNICDSNNLINISKKLQDINIVHGDYKLSKSFIDSDTLVYFDPPYKPLSKTSSFTKYNKEGFYDIQQQELSYYINYLKNKGASIILSNSNPRHINNEDNFFDELYADFDIFTIPVSRVISADAKKRGTITELLISTKPL